MVLSVNKKEKNIKYILKCPDCGSSNIAQTRCLEGPIWCLDCGCREDRKEIHNPFIIKVSTCASLSKDCDIYKKYIKKLEEYVSLLEDLLVDVAANGASESYTNVDDSRSIGNIKIELRKLKDKLL